jgi:hypothetical protein
MIGSPGLNPSLLFSSVGSMCVPALFAGISEA